MQAQGRDFVYYKINRDKSQNAPECSFFPISNPLGQKCTSKQIIVVAEGVNSHERNMT